MIAKEQLDEMAKLICNYSYCIHYNEIGGCVKAGCRTVEIAKNRYNKGYRAHNREEWISIDDRMPETSGKYIVCTNNDKVYQATFYSHPENKGGHWGQKDKGRNITHWMPFPKAPKGE